jgi:hypothetical protein
MLFVARKQTWTIHTFFGSSVGLISIRRDAIVGCLCQSPGGKMEALRKGRCALEIVSEKLSQMIVDDQSYQEDLVSWKAGRDPVVELHESVVFSEAL